MVTSSVASHATIHHKIVEWLRPGRRRYFSATRLANINRRVRVIPPHAAQTCDVDPLAIKLDGPVRLVVHELLSQVARNAHGSLHLQPGRHCSRSLDLKARALSPRSLAARARGRSTRTGAGRPRNPEDVVSIGERIAPSGVRFTARRLRDDYHQRLGVHWHFGPCPAV